jgi:hypothetical protein
MSFQGSASAAFHLYPLRFRQATPRVRALSRRAWSPNTLRGAFGAALKHKDADAYARYFAPTAPRGAGPSGLANPPRPFVFRFASEAVGLNLFTTREPAIDLLTDVMGELGFELIEAPILLCLSLAPSPKPISRLRVRFLTPTELGRATGGLKTQTTGSHEANGGASRPDEFLAPSRKGGDENYDSRPYEARLPHRAPIGTQATDAAAKLQSAPTSRRESGDDAPEFGILARRIRDRISTLRALYGSGPLDIDFKAFGECAAHIQMTRCEVSRVEAERVSKGTGQRHSLGGLTGFAEYEGELAAFLPYLEAARYTGVGRQTVWGKGEISVEEI